MRLCRLLILLIPACGLLAKEHVEEIYQGNGAAVTATETAQTVELDIRAPYGVIVSIRVDRNNNHMIDPDFDLGYARLDNGQSCFMYLVGEHATRRCGTLRSSAVIRAEPMKTDRSYSLSIPKIELSSNGQSASFSIAVNRQKDGQWQPLDYPDASFATTIDFPFEIQ